MSSLLERLKKNSTIKETASFDDSKLLNGGDICTTDIPALNIALSGSLDGGITSGLFLAVGKSKSFKTSMCLCIAKAYLDKHKDSVLIFMDSEFGSPKNYFDSFGIDTARVLHIPIMDIEEFKFEIVNQLEKEIKRTDRVIIVVDSIGNLASRKEREDSLAEKSVGDMSRAKQLKSCFRMITPYLTKLDVPMLCVNHSYESQGMFAQTIVSGGTGIYYSANTIFIISRSQEKEGTDVVGYNFNINIEKSRFVKEKSKIPINVNYNNGISKWSGLLDMALEAGLVIKPSTGWFSRINTDTGELEEKKYRAKDTNNADFWTPILNSPKFKQWVEDRYKIANGAMLTDDYIDAELESIDIDDIDMEY
jgi:RecA/RadA recombinase